MRTLLLITITLFALSVRGQSKVDTAKIINNQFQFIQDPPGVSNFTFSTTIIDSTATQPDTTYSVKANVPYMDIAINFQNAEKKWWQSTVTYKYNGKSWDVSGMALKYSDLLNNHFGLIVTGYISTSNCLSCGLYLPTLQPIKKSKKK